MYHAVDSHDKELAIKIYKTSILIFKDRERYVAGDFRFRHGFNKSNPRKMVAMWAEKERRNLGRYNCLFPFSVDCARSVFLFLKHMDSRATFW